MKHVAISVMLLALAPYGSARAEFLSGNDLYNYLNSTQVEYRTSGLGYVMGVFDTTKGVLHCAPTTITSGQAKDVVHQYLRTAPENRHYSANSIVVYVLRSMWPCQQSGREL